MIPEFSAIDFVSFYIEIPIMLVMYLVWMIIWRPGPPSPPISLPTDEEPGAGEPPKRKSVNRRVWEFVSYNDAVDIETVDLRRDEHEEEAEDVEEDLKREGKLKGRWRWLWRVYYAVV